MESYSKNDQQIGLHIINLVNDSSNSNNSVCLVLWM